MEIEHDSKKMRYFDVKAVLTRAQCFCHVSRIQTQLLSLFRLLRK